ncbi:MAG: hypothetical protein WC460_03030 [Patescibacteria group bacterium]
MCLGAEKTDSLFFAGTEHQVVDLLLEDKQSIREVNALVETRGIAFTARVLRMALKKAGKSDAERAIEKLRLAINLQFTQKIDNLTAEQLGEFSNCAPNLFGILDAKKEEASP